MSEPTDIEKKSLEAHVELCSQRYRYLEEKLDSMQEKIDSLTESVKTVQECVQRMSDKNTDRLITWGVGIIGFLCAILGWVFANYVFK